MDVGIVFLVSALMKLLTINSKLYFSTDFEVHRNWLSITQSVPFSEWYIEARNKWTLDYPPFFAYFEYILGLIGRHVDPRITDVNAIDYAALSAITFQRLSVIFISDAILAFSINKIVSSKNRVPALLLTLFTSTLFIVDHIHFQYNGMLLGLLLLSIGLVEEGKFYWGAISYMILVFFKHIYLFAAPVYFVYFLRHFIFSAASRRVALQRFLGLVSILFSVSVVALGPIIASGQWTAMMTRLFPFGRGLVHSYWAPNFWALYVASDRLLGSFLRISGGASPTAGLVGEISLVVLPNITPMICAILTIVGYLILLWYPRRLSFGTLVGLGNAVAFYFGWHVHEKALLMVTFPLVLSALADGRQSSVSRDTVWRMTALCCASVLPLLPRGQETPLKWAIAAAGLALDSFVLGTSVSFKWIFCVFGSEIYRVFLHEYIFGPNGMPFLPLLLTSVSNSLALFWCLGMCLRPKTSKSKRA